MCVVLVLRRRCRVPTYLLAVLGPSFEWRQQASRAWFGLWQPVFHFFRMQEELVLG
jgi:hypothetical protein